ncbi:type I-E CRISPR-associated protein Cas5/CasD [Marichromatium gracile]|uniref:Type I-E CRISPR-associated protein Cas5/CasD n=1 Tax=Marichromatium gracile TaxID=1048 RepID=A0ABR5VJR7_MARGR|nr:type I-E CRISPR-associated protein Cas5/CasD [Marichromatium gracile]KXX65946.1 type I-E CRISPR-associated protein Cas5/CasD [Marichromatium gracile]
MARYLILRLDGPMQSWGTHTFEDYRPSNAFPTRSALVGLIGACLGIARGDAERISALAASIEISVRADRKAQRPEEGESSDKSAIRERDYHTVLDARKVDGSTNRHPIQSHREYLFDASFTVAIGARPNAAFDLDRIATALRRPLFTPVLGRRSCPLAHPLVTDGVIEAADALAALDGSPPTGGPIYTEQPLAHGRTIPIRDVPHDPRRRQFANRLVYLHRQEGEA